MKLNTEDGFEYVFPDNESDFQAYIATPRGKESYDQFMKDLETSYKALPWYKKFWLFLRNLVR